MDLVDTEFKIKIVNILRDIGKIWEILNRKLQRRTKW